MYSQTSAQKTQDEKEMVQPMGHKCASQIVRQIYSALEDHPLVNEYENVKGISKNLFFVDHSFHEETSGNPTVKQMFTKQAFSLPFAIIFFVKVTIPRSLRY